uniref:Uncharacterized protein n=1 Tax=Glossina austeni TaxID=7395 RepID=A0A1A9ULQ5_GLOAU
MMQIGVHRTCLNVLINASNKSKLQLILTNEFIRNSQGKTKAPAGSLRDQKVHQQPEKRLSANNKVGRVLISNSVCFILMFGVKAGNKVVGKARRTGQRSMKVNVSVKHIESAGMRVNNTTATSSSLSLYYLKTSLSSIA